MSMLRAAVDTVADRVPVLLDSGVRRGIDIFRALALGATAAGMGRPALWAWPPVDRSVSEASTCSLPPN